MHRIACIRYALVRVFCVYVLCARLYTTVATVASPRRAHRPSRRLNRRRSSNQRPGRSVETAETPNSIIVSGIVIVISRPIGRLTGKRTSCGSTLFLLFTLIVFLFHLFLFSFFFFLVLCRNSFCNQMLVYLWQRLFFYILTSLNLIICFVNDFALHRKPNFVQFI